MREGDLLVTSGLGRRFPGGYPVAVVTAVDRAEGRTFARVEAAPLAALDRGGEVLLISVPDDPEPSGVPDEMGATEGQDATAEASGESLE